MSSSPQVVTFGETMMAFFSPLDTPLAFGGTAHCTFGGAESNVSIGLARLGHQVRWLSALGNDVFGREILLRLRGEGVDVSAVKLDDTAKTGVMFQSRRPWAEPEVLYYRSNSAFSQLPADSFPETQLTSARILLLGGIAPALGDGPYQLTLRLLEAARRQGIPIWFDVNYRGTLWSREAARERLLPIASQADVLLAGKEEAHLLLGESADQNTETLAKALRHLGPSEAVLKLGTEGSLWTRPEGTYRGEALRLERIASPIGAGDAFAAGLLSGILDGLPPQDALRRAHAVAAMVCLGSGDWENLPRRDELNNFLENKFQGR